MTGTCRAVVFNGDGTLEIREYPVPDAPSGGAVIRVEAVGMCGSDAGQFLGVSNTPNGVYPCVPGHEIVGRIHRISPEAAAAWKVSEGDLVAVNEILVTPQGKRIYGHDFSADDPPGLLGGFAEYMVLLPGTEVFALTSDRPATELTLFEPLANAIAWTEQVREGDTVVIQGPGHLGLCCVVAAKQRGAAEIIVTGTADDGARLAVAREVGATHTINVSDEDAAARVAEITSTTMADVVIDAAAGSTQTVPLAIELTRYGGHITLAGLKKFKAVDGFVSDWIPLRQLTIHPGGQLQFQRAVDLINAGSIPTHALVGELFPLEKVEDALQLLDRKMPGHDAVRVGLAIAPSDLSI
jgi:threonine dehydrogenase-like Zn-dependent dehydrogenase